MSDDFIPLDVGDKKKSKKDKKRKREEDVGSEVTAIKKSKTEKADKPNEGIKQKKEKKQKKSDEAKQERKEKKERKSKKSKKTDRGEDITEPAPENNTAETHNEPSLEAEKVLEEVEEKKSKREKKEKKEKKKRKADDGGDLQALEAVQEPKKSKKSKKPKKNSEEAITEAIAADEPTTGQDEIPVPREPTKEELKELEQTAKQDGTAEAIPLTNGEDSVTQTENASANKKDRFIVFVGNLPYSATKETLEKHFAKVTPSAVRLQTDRKTGKAKGFAFVEFDHYDKMKTCLKLYHHTEIDGRKINIELTAGGGGNSSHRKEKVQYKNEKLHDQRQRRFQEEEKKKKRQDAKVQRDQNSKKGKKAQAATGGHPMGLDGTTDGVPEAAGAGDAHAGIHPSRLARMGL